MKFNKKLAIVCACAVISAAAVLCAALARHNAAINAYASRPLGGRVVVLDAGHGGADGGAIGVNGISESGINLSVTLKTDALLRLFGVNTVLTRDSDVSVHSSYAKTIAEQKKSDIRNRASIVRNTPNAVLITIHQNSFPDEKYGGAQMFYGKNRESAPLAETAQAMFALIQPDNAHRAKPVANNVYLMNNSTCPALLAECGFISNWRDAKLLSDAEYQMKVAAVIAASYLKWSGDDAQNA